MCKGYLSSWPRQGIGLAASLAVEDEEKVQQKLALHPRMGWSPACYCTTVRTPDRQ